MDVENIFHKKAAKAFTDLIVVHVNKLDGFECRKNPVIDNDYDIVVRHTNGYRRVLRIDDRYVCFNFQDRYDLSISDPNYMDNLLQIVKDHFIQLEAANVSRDSE